MGEATNTKSSATSRFERSDFQVRIEAFMIACFGREIADDVRERNHRFIEESLELVQAKGCTAEEAHMLVDYVFGRPVGDPHQETGGVMVTLAALCNAAGLSMERAGEDELARVWTKLDVIREKQRNKPRNSPLPMRSETAPPVNEKLREACELAERMLRDGGTFPIRGQTWKLLNDALQYFPRIETVGSASSNDIKGAIQLGALQHVGMSDVDKLAVRTERGPSK